MVMLPVGLVHVGCTRIAVGAGGLPGIAFTLAVAAAETHPVMMSLTVKLYEAPGESPAKTPLG